ncbi:protein mono-ADP-ribosyltransferase PARP12-like isoform X2 [Haliotis asinina]|uniref:protein mono-ADP-ribosyltransferase PARP12-like isoform X2 n=1 Tax=Haliotis asinina TaxID=109174 RepID=UPI0035321A00
MAEAFPQDNYAFNEADNNVRAILKVLCRYHDCSVDLTTLQRTFQRNGQRVPKNLLGLLQDYRNNFIQEGNSVKAFTNLQLCPKHCKRDGYCGDDYCEKLHICKFFLLSNCRFSSNGIQCQFGHDLDSDHNKSILQQNLLDELTDVEIQRLFQSKSSRGVTTIPQICRFYNHVKGCSKKSVCQHLHICEFYVKGTCKFGTGCRRNHDIDYQIKKILLKFGVSIDRRPKDIIEDIRKMTERVDNSNLQQQPLGRFSSVPMLGNQSSLSSHHWYRPNRVSESLDTEADPNSDEICMYHLRGGRGCSFQNSCIKFHKTKTFQWQYCGKTDSDWVDFEDYVDEKLEKAFCTVERSECTVLSEESDSEDDEDDDEDGITVDFINMTATSKERQLSVRRLGTASHATLPPHIARSFVGQVTRWIWYWFDDRLEEWRQYGNVVMAPIVIFLC